MLFQSFYNWIRYKSNPPSLFFKNRLFIERDGQSSRIFAQFGQTFRSSKWNLTSNFGTKFHFKRYNLLFSFLIVFVLLNLTGTLSFLFNILSFFFWVGTDMFDYYLSFFVWFTYFFFSLCYNHIYLYFFYNNFSTNTASTRQNQTGFVSSSHHFKTSPTAPQINLNWVLYTWITKSSNTPLFTSLTAKLFNSNTALSDNAQHLIFWKTNYNFFNKLYKLIFCQTLNDQNISSYSPHSTNLTTIKKNYFYSSTLGTGASPTNTFLLLNVWYDLTTWKSYFNDRTEAHAFAPSLANWFFNINQTYSFLTKQKLGLYSNTCFNFEQINKLINTPLVLQITQNSITDSIALGKLNRWLYRYFVLNRKLLKNSHKWVNLKTSTTSSFVNSTNFSRNLWNSHFFSNSTNFKTLASWNYFANDTKNFFQTLSHSQSSQLNFEQNFSNFSKFSFLENSYFWLVKRFFFFNNLSSNWFFFKNTKLAPTTINYLKQGDSALANDFYLLSPAMSHLAINSINFKANFFTEFTLNTAFSSVLSKHSHDINLIFSYNEFFNLTNLKFLNLLNNFEISHVSFPYLLDNNDKFNNAKSIKRNTFYRTSGVATQKVFKHILFFQTNDTFYRTSLKNLVVLFGDRFK